MRHLTWLFLLTAAALPLSAQDPKRYDYRVLATSRTSTMEKEMNEAADAGYYFGGVMGGDTAAGGKEVVVVMIKDADTKSDAKRVYKLLATSRTSTMQKELQQAADEGYEFQGSTVFQSSFGGKEVAVILERNSANPAARPEYRLVATSRTSTMQKEIQQAGDQGFKLCGVMVGKTAMGGAEIISVLRRSGK